MTDNEVQAINNNLKKSKLVNGKYYIIFNLILHSN